jgi:hypothetical protein
MALVTSPGWMHILPVQRGTPSVAFPVMAL